MVHVKHFYLTSTNKNMKNNPCYNLSMCHLCMHTNPVYYCMQLFFGGIWCWQCGHNQLIISLKEYVLEVKEEANMLYSLSVNLFDRYSDKLNGN